MLPSCICLVFFHHRPGPADGNWSGHGEKQGSSVLDDIDRFVLSSSSPHSPSLRACGNGVIVPKELNRPEAASLGQP
jgi:hypothetical protein